MNRQKFSRLILVAGAALMVGNAMAAPLNLLGLDDMSCTAWSQSKDDPDQRTVYIDWIRGFLTGHNYALPKQQVSTISSGTISEFVDRHCRQNPTEQFSDAAMRLSDQFSGRNQPIRR